MKEITKIRIIFLTISLYLVLVLPKNIVEPMEIRMIQAAAITQEIIVEEPPVEQPKLKLRYAGMYKISFYAATLKSCGNTDGIGAGGQPVVPYYTVATVRIGGFKMGTMLYIEDFGIVQVGDTLNSGVYGRRLDLCVASDEEAFDIGIKNKKVWVIIN